MINRNEHLRGAYKEWLFSMVAQPNSPDFNHMRLLEYLHQLYVIPEEFARFFPLDANRVSDGIDLRRRFAYETEIEEHQLNYIFHDVMGCSVLELLVALANRCEQVMERPNESRVERWFWSMIHNLKLGDATDDNFNKNYVNLRIDIFVNRKYSKNGKGGLFYVPYCAEDMRMCEVWQQANIWLNKQLEEDYGYE